MSNEYRIENKETTFKGITVPELPRQLRPTLLEEIGLNHNHNYSREQLLYEIQSKLSEFGINTPIKPANSEVRADYAVACHQAVKQGKNINEIIAILRDKYGQAIDFSLQGMFLNFSINRQLMFETAFREVTMLGNQYGFNTSGEGKKVILDVSSPNVAKHMHLGHLRSTVIGESLRRIYTANGYNAIADNHLGDWGTQFGILGHAYELWGNEIPELNDPEQQVSGLLKLYVRMNTAIAEEKEQNPDGESALEDAGRAWFTSLEQGDERAKELWRWAYELSIKEFNKIYELLGVDFEYILGESLYATQSEDVYREFEERGIAKRDEKGRLRAVPTEKSKLPPLTIQKSDGSSLYATRDLACLADRTAWFNPEEIVYVVGEAQGDYFRQLFNVFEQFATDSTPKMKHVNFGEIVLPEGKMSTRKGNVVFLNDVLQETFIQAYDRVGKNALSRNSQLSEDELKDVAWKVAVGAVIYYDLKQTANRNIEFKWEEALSFEGNTGPYLQYACARMNALLSGYDESTSPNSEHIEQTGPQADLLQLIDQFPEVVKQAMSKQEPSVISDFAYKLAHNFNKFYKEYPILKETDPTIKATRLALTNITRQTLGNALWLLNIPIPDRM